MKRYDTKLRVVITWENESFFNHRTEARDSYVTQITFVEKKPDISWSCYLPVRNIIMLGNDLTIISDVAFHVTKGIDFTIEKFDRITAFFASRKLRGEGYVVNVFDNN